MQAKQVWRPGKGRDYALMPNGDVVSVNATGLTVRDVRWYAVQAGKFVGDAKDAEFLASIGYTNVERYQAVTAPAEGKS